MVKGDKEGVVVEPATNCIKNDCFLTLSGYAYDVPTVHHFVFFPFSTILFQTFP